MISNGMNSLLWFIAIVAMIPVALWLLKRTPMGNGGGNGVMRSVATLPLSANQRVVMVEVGRGESRRCLVLGVTAQNITALYSLGPQEAEVPVAAPMPAFAQLLGRLRQDKGTAGEP